MLSTPRSTHFNHQINLLALIVKYKIVIVMDAIRPHLQTLTHNLPAPIRNTVTSFIGEDCYTVLVHDVNLFDSSSTQCLTLAISKAIGIAIILAASIVKIPQILKLVSSRSAAGLSFLAYLLETTSFLISLAYSARSNFPFSTYGETALIAVQNVVIAVLVLQFSGRAPAAAVFVAGMASLVYVLLGRSDLVSLKALTWLQAGAGVLSVASKAPQIYTVWREGGTGQLSAFAVCPFLHHTANLFPGTNFPRIRSSTTSQDPSPVSSLRCVRSTTKSFWLALSQASPSMPSLQRKCSITGTAPLPGVHKQLGRVYHRVWRRVRALLAPLQERASQQVHHRRLPEGRALARGAEAEMLHK